MRGRGVKSDVNKQNALKLYKILIYSRRPNGEVPKIEDYATPKQRKYISKRMDSLIAARDYKTLAGYLKGVLKRFPGEYYIKLQLSEYLPRIGDKKGALKYAEEAYRQAAEDALADLTMPTHCGSMTEERKPFIIIRKCLIWELIILHTQSMAKVFAMQSVSSELLCGV